MRELLRCAGFVVRKGEKKEEKKKKKKEENGGWKGKNEKNKKKIKLKMGSVRNRPSQ